MKLEVLPGRKGDCMLLHLEQGGEEKLVLIDGGPSGVWGDHLEDRLKELQEERAPDGKLRIDLVIVSHVDDDHINGILRLFHAIEHDRFPAEIGELWHNSFDHILGNREIPAANSETVLASIAQGDRLHTQAKRLGIDVNTSFEDRFVRAGESQSNSTLSDAQVAVLGPSERELESLQNKFDNWLEDQEELLDAASVLANLKDRSTANLSSIVLDVAQASRRFLLTGDALTERFVDSMGEGPHLFDVIKMPHHGSERNVDAAFFATVIGKSYVFSGNGKHGNPERVTIEMLLDNRPADTIPELVFTYPIDKIDATRKTVWEKEQKRRQDQGKSVTPWDHETMSLAAMFIERAGTFELVEPDASGWLEPL